VRGHSRLRHSWLTVLHHYRTAAAAAVAVAVKENGMDLVDKAAVAAVVAVAGIPRPDQALVVLLEVYSCKGSVADVVADVVAVDERQGLPVGQRVVGGMIAEF